VVMGVASIIITAAFIILTQFTTFFSNTSRSQSETSELIKYYNNLQRDFHGANVIVKNGNEITCEFDNHKVSYQLESDVLVRDFLEVKDSLFTTVLEVSVDYIFQDNSNGVIKNLYLNFETLGQEFSWGLYKFYGSSIYINNKEDQ
jgi:hypothetical protein